MYYRDIILLVDDEEIVLRALQHILAVYGFGVIAASSGEEALRRAEGQPIDLLLVDVVMPGMSGPELARRLRDLHPKLRVLFMAGMPDTPMIRTEVVQAGFPLLPKPFMPSQLLEAIVGVLGRRRAMRAAS